MRTVAPRRARCPTLGAMDREAAPGPAANLMSPGASSGVREERKVLTALFADLVGSTALADTLDPGDVANV